VSYSDRFSRTSRPKSIKLETNYLWVKGIQVCSNNCPGSLQREDNYENIKMGLGHLKSSSLEL
jgi:Pyruvate/2-oxoacid:ferredoxin oxidoreductase delta subunit